MRTSMSEGEVTPDMPIPPPPLTCQYLYFCISKASRLSTFVLVTRRAVHSGASEQVAASPLVLRTAVLSAGAARLGASIGHILALQAPQQVAATTSESAAATAAAALDRLQPISRQARVQSNSQMREVQRPKLAPAAIRPPARTHTHTHTHTTSGIGHAQRGGRHRLPCFAPRISLAKQNTRKGTISRRRK
jgi:hypothetical protein